MKLDQLNSKTRCTPADVCSTSVFMHVAGCVCDDDGQVAHLPRILHQSSLPFSALGWQGSVSSRVCDYSEEEEGRGRRRRQVKSVHFGVAISANAARRDNWSFQEPFFWEGAKREGGPKMRGPAWRIREGGWAQVNCMCSAGNVFIHWANGDLKKNKQKKKPSSCISRSKHSPHMSSTWAKIRWDKEAAST